MELVPFEIVSVEKQHIKSNINCVSSNIELKNKLKYCIYDAKEVNSP